jgi:hypothetical protein
MADWNLEMADMVYLLRTIDVLMCFVGMSSLMKTLYLELSDNAQIV